MKLHEIADLLKSIRPLEIILEDEENCRLEEGTGLANAEGVLINVGDLRKLINTIRSMDID